MKTNCRISKIIASLLLMSTILCFGVTGFAASYTTVTTYNLDEEGTVEVTSTVTGIAGSDEQVTYLALNGDDEIIYVDQEKVKADGTQTFSYVTDVATIGTGTTKVLFGATTTEVTPNLTPSGIIASKNISVTAGNSTIASDGYDITSGVTVGYSQEIPFTITPASGYAVTDVEVNGASVFVSGTLTYSIDVDGVASPSIVVETELVPVAPGLDSFDDEDNFETAPVADREISLFAKLQFTPGSTVEYGIIAARSRSGEPLTKEEVIAGGTKYKAYGYDDGTMMFAVKLIGGGGLTAGGDTVFESGKYFAVTYLLVEGEAPVYGELASFDCDVR